MVEVYNHRAALFDKDAPRISDATSKDYKRARARLVNKGKTKVRKREKGKGKQLGANASAKSFRNDKPKYTTPTSDEKLNKYCDASSQPNTDRGITLPSMNRQTSLKSIEGRTPNLDFVDFEDSNTEWSNIAVRGDEIDDSLFDELCEELKDMNLAGEQQPTDNTTNTNTRRILIQSLIRKCWNIFAQGEIEDTTEHSGNTIEESRFPTGEGTTYDSKTTGPQSRKRRRNQGSGSERGADDGDGDQSKPPSSKRPSPDNQPEYDVRFACPFRKHNPRKYSIFSPHRSCTVSGWKTISRVK